MNHRSDAVAAFVTAAREWSALIRGSIVLERPGPAWTASLLGSLARLFAAAQALPEAEDAPDVPPGTRMGHEEWRRAYDALARLLGPSAAYWHDLDPRGEAPPDRPRVCGDLADDLADIYRNVDSGLRAYDLGGGYREAALFEWRLQRDVHWGAHATWALRVLHLAVADAAP
jgi:hypothetical protein